MESGRRRGDRARVRVRGFRADQRADEPERIRDALVRQAFSPVRWIETVQEMARRGMSHVIECGPGKVLAGMTKRIAKEVEGGSAHDAASLEQSIAAVRA